jgi:hypothetical protein
VTDAIRSRDPIGDQFSPAPRRPERAEVGQLLQRHVGVEGQVAERASDLAPAAGEGEVDVGLEFAAFAGEFGLALKAGADAGAFEAADLSLSLTVAESGPAGRSRGSR